MVCVTVTVYINRSDKNGDTGKLRSLAGEWMCSLFSQLVVRDGATGTIHV